MRQFANSLLIAERLQREKEFKMKLDQAKRWGVSVGQIEKLWEADKVKKVMELNAIAKAPRWTSKEVKDADELRSIMEEYECEEYKAKQIQSRRAKRQVQASDANNSGPADGAAEAGGGTRRREPEVTVIRRLVPNGVKLVGR